MISIPHPLRLRKQLIALLAVCLALQATEFVQSQDTRQADLVVADFEGDSYGDWITEGDAFGTGPAKGTLPGQMQVSGYAGSGLVNSFQGGDRTTGTLTSPPFEVERDYLTFLIGGGGHANQTCMNLLVDGQVIQTITGENTNSGGSEALAPAFWNLSELAGQTVQIQIVDRATGGWGHINVDHLVQTNIKPNLPEWDRREKEFVVTDTYLVIPIENAGRGKGQIHLFANDKEVRRYDLTIATSAETTDWYAYFTIDAYQGQNARVVATQVTDAGFAAVRQSNHVPGEEKFYQEPHRPQFHFTQKVGWINDPNGMVYHDGTWHFFFQHNPVALPWGNMTWGHATSQDLLHWEQQPNKLFPKTMATGSCFSGGATVDKHNTSGWGENTLVAFLTDTGAGEAVTYSNDGGKTFQWYEGNPIVKHQGRDPKVIWYPYADADTPLNDAAKQLGGHWVMVVYDEHPQHGKNAAFHTSINLKDWTLESHLPGYFECTELFELPIDGEQSNSRWVVFAADAKYAIGSFDGKVFTPEHEGKHQVHWGDYYASQTFDNAPDGRRIQMGWLRINAPGPYNQHFSFPHELSLRTTDDGVRMFAQPIAEIEALRSNRHQLPAQDLIADEAISLAVGSDLLDVQFTIELGTASSLELTVAGRTIGYDAKTQNLNETPLKPVDGKISVRVLADRSLTEIIGNEGRVFISGPGPAQQNATPITVTARGGTAKLLTLEAHELRSIWSDAAGSR
ncbi:glycoside hydrolase family 32 protein [Rhodopirellula sp. P2]|uniref:glycoside hydrolase family 32 protein n=1 Tax=Rhodopirellula sp. P2 TaxID=2127060 RepID=UPI00236837E3|nr:glycoside hydrolase family 32 protein [Rhodopirellula sp. P2]WDQ16170.1 glycoside hydrolase family 32 protein [Rhodopirellula sp. P2]